jgi:hypothetical protein
MLYLWLHQRAHLPIGLHGAILPFLMVPVGAVVASHLGVLVLSAHGANWFQTCEIPYSLIAPIFLAALVVYYLVWKYIVGTLNRVLGID